MRVLLQRVTSAQVLVDDAVVGSIGKGILAFVGLATGDTAADADWIASRICNARLWESNGKSWAGSVETLGYSVLLVSQFTLHASTKKPRPDFHKAMPTEPASAMFDALVGDMQRRLGPDRVATGVFGAMMQVALVNDGPVTIMADSWNREGTFECPTPTSPAHALKASPTPAPPATTATTGPVVGAVTSSSVGGGSSAEVVCGDIAGGAESSAAASGGEEGRTDLHLA